MSSLTLGFPGGTSSKELPATHRDLRDVGLIPESGKSPRGGHGNPLQYSCLENPMNRGVWRAAVHGVTKSWAQLKRLSRHTHTPFQTVCVGMFDHRNS